MVVQRLRQRHGWRSNRQQGNSEIPGLRREKLPLARAETTPGSNQLFGLIDRPRIWATTTLTIAQVDEEFDDECDAVIVPSTAFFDADLSDGWTTLGSPVFADDNHGVGVAFEKQYVLCESF